jgi:hypothetical protein
MYPNKRKFTPSLASAVRRWTSRRTHGEENYKFRDTVHAFPYMIDHDYVTLETKLLFRTLLLVSDCTSQEINTWGPSAPTGILFICRLSGKKVKLSL